MIRRSMNSFFTILLDLQKQNLKPYKLLGDRHSCFFLFNRLRTFDVYLVVIVVCSNYWCFDSLIQIESLDRFLTYIL